MKEMKEMEIPNRNSSEQDELLRGTLGDTENITNESGKEEPKKVNSFTTILSIWNSMIGSNTVVLHNNVYNAGIIPAIFLSIIYGLICFYTCKIYVDFGMNEPDFSITIQKYLNKMFGPKIAKIGKNIQIIFNTLITLGGVLIYFLIMSQNLYPIVCLILEKIGVEVNPDTTPEFGRFSLIYLSIALCFALFPFTIKKDIGFLVKLSSYGIYFISILIIFQIYVGISSLINTDFYFAYKKNKTDSNKRYLLLFGENPAIMAGAISLGYFCHTTILPTLKSNKNQKNNISDLFIAYVCVCFTFAFVGIMGYIGFSGKNFDAEFQQNWFYFFDYDDYYILFFRLLSVFQLMTVFPILVYVVRFHFFNFIYGNEYPSKKHTIIYGICVLILCLFIVYFFHKYLANLLGIIGATTSLILIYSFPPFIKMISYFLKLRGDDIYGKTKDNLANKSIQIDTDAEETEETHGKSENNDKKVKFGYKNILYFVAQSSLLLIGIATVIFQYVPINFFNIKLED